MKKERATGIYETDVLIAGAGMAGYAAAIAAAETGKRVTILEKSGATGGAAVLSNVGTLCGLYYRGPLPAPVSHPMCFALMDRLTATYPQTKVVSLPDGLHVVAYDKAELNHVLRKHLFENDVTTKYGAHIINVQADRDRVLSITFLDFWGDYQYTIHSKAFIDCTGNGFLAEALGHPMLRTDTYQAAAQVIRFENVKPTTEYALNLSLRKAMRETQEHQHWPQAYTRLSVVPGSLREGCFDIKLPLTGKVFDEKDLVKKLQKEVEQVLPRLVKTFKKIESLTEASVLEIARMPGVRIQKRPQGQHLLTHFDVIQCTKPEDGIALGTWPIEEWSYDGKVNMEYFAEDNGYLIPARCLRSPIFQNLYFAGKGIAADDKAIASARVTGTCLQTGYAAGKLAASNDERQQKDIIHALRTTLIRKP